MGGELTVRYPTTPPLLPPSLLLQVGYVTPQARAPRRPATALALTVADLGAGSVPGAEEEEEEGDEHNIDEHYEEEGEEQMWAMAGAVPQQSPSWREGTGR
jgi:hypothetical protein